ncbi:MAG TPA: hypothetical protein VF665_19535 [Longimicrobium sp.]|uniref:hypothetical protein n=1 Tax=Longimicrobium sp. TaxID=2029185 RepID=UPI002ED98746
MQHRTDCRLAAQILSSDQPHTRAQWALEYAQACPEDGPPALVALWDTVSGAEPGLSSLTASTMYIRDRRIYDQALAVAGSRDRPVRVRTHAMLILVKYVIPSSSIRPSDLEPPDTIEHVRVPLGSTTRDYQTQGTQAVGSEIGPEVLAVLERIASDREGEPREVWYAAARLARRVRWELEPRRAK